MDLTTDFVNRYIKKQSDVISLLLNEKIQLEVQVEILQLQIEELTKKASVKKEKNGTS